MANKFRFIITDLFDGCLKGTNDEELANVFAENEEFFVYDSEVGEWLHASGEYVPIEEMEKPEASEPGSEGEGSDED